VARKASPRRRHRVDIDIAFLPDGKGKGVEDRDDRPRRRKAKAPRVALAGKRKLCKPVDICGQRYRVLLDDEYDSKKNEGQCTWADNLIELLAQAPDRVHDALMHEIVHAVNDASGLKWAIANRFPKLTLKERRALDEMLCRFLAPALLATLRNAGWLKLPSVARKAAAS
jgi:hypothetical protein